MQTLLDDSDNNPFSAKRLGRRKEGKNGGHFARCDAGRRTWTGVSNSSSRRLRFLPSDGPMLTE